jgi:hypothetical protein
MNPPFFPNQEKVIFNLSLPKDFIKCRDKLPQHLFAFLTLKTESDYLESNTKLHLSSDLKSGFGINPDGELISVFALEKSRGKILVAAAKNSGAKQLSCMGDHLLSLYSEFGFSVTNMELWNNKFAPVNWNYERFGTPNIYDMKLVNPYKDKFDK